MHVGNSAPCWAERLSEGVRFGVLNHKFLLIAVARTSCVCVWLFCSAACWECRRHFQMLFQQWKTQSSVSSWTSAHYLIMLSLEYIWQIEFIKSIFFLISHPCLLPVNVLVHLVRTFRGTKPGWLDFSATDHSSPDLFILLFSCSLSLSPPCTFLHLGLALPICFSHDILPITISKPFVTDLQRASYEFSLFLFSLLFLPQNKSQHYTQYILPATDPAYTSLRVWLCPSIQAGGGDGPILQKTPTLWTLQEYKQIPIFLHLPCSGGQSVDAITQNTWCYTSACFTFEECYIWAAERSRQRKLQPEVHVRQPEPGQSCHRLQAPRALLQSCARPLCCFFTSCEQSQLWSCEKSGLTEGSQLLNCLYPTTCHWVGSSVPTLWQVWFICANLLIAAILGKRALLAFSSPSHYLKGCEKNIWIYVESLEFETQRG